MRWWRRSELIGHALVQTLFRQPIRPSRDWVYRRGMQGLVTRHKDGSALTPEEKRAQSSGLWRSLWDPARRGDLVLVIGGMLVGAGFLAPIWWWLRGLTG